MKVYLVTIPEPKAERMRGPCTVVVRWSRGWGGEGHSHYPARSGEAFKFAVPDGLEYGNRDLDGAVFWVEVVFSNQSGSRHETVDLVPVEIAVAAEVSP